MRKVVRLWRFEPPTVEETPAPARVAVLACSAPPRSSRSASGAEKNLGAIRGNPLPYVDDRPRLSAQALDSGVVMLEVEVDEKGAVAGVEILNQTEGGSKPSPSKRRGSFDSSPRSATASGSSFAVVIFGFPQPVTPVRRDEDSRGLD